MKSLYVKLGAVFVALAIQSACGDDLGQYGYHMNGGVCYSNVNNRVVDQGLCNNTGYFWANNQCYANNSQVVDASLCANIPNTGAYGNNGYYLYGGQCYSPQGQIVAQNLCANTGYNNGYGQQAQQCYGTYYSNSGYGQQPIQCSGTNCRGYTLVNAQGQQVLCQ